MANLVQSAQATRIKKLVNILLLLSASPAWADSANEQFQRGIDAAKRGDYATALKEWRPLAEEEQADAQHYLGLMYDAGLASAMAGS